MFRARVLPFAFILLALNTSPAQAADATPSRVSHVTLYRGQAQVTRIVPVDGDAGSREIVVGDLPEQVVPNSLFAEGGDAVEIRAVRFRTRPVGEEPRQEVRDLDQKIREAQQQIDVAAKRQALLGKRTEYLAKLEGFIAPTAQTDLAKGVLDAEALERLTMFNFAQHEKIAEEEVNVARELHDLNEGLELLQRKRAEITAGASRTEREAVLYLQKQAAGPAEVRLNYLVGNCGWSPAYTMRSNADHKQVQVEYNALIHQLTGEDWNDVILTLSTASPALSAAGPGLAPYHVTLRAEQAPNQQQTAGDLDLFGRGLSKGQAIEQIQGINAQRRKFAQAANNSIQFAEQNRINWSLNDVAYGLQQLELNCDANTLAVLRNEIPSATNGPSLSYRLAGGVSLASRSDQQMVRIMQTDMPSHFYRVAVPVLTSYDYREAELTNSSDDDLLAGPITVYLDGHFVGQSEIPTVARGQAFVVGFGADPQLRARRELADRDDGVQGGNRETRFEYRLVVENFASEMTPVRVLDRLPHAENDADIEVTLGKTSDPISADKLYQREERPMGLLRGDIDVPANASGEEARLITYHYAVEYDRQYVVSLPESKQSLQEEFERLQRGRQKR